MAGAVGVTPAAARSVNRPRWNPRGRNEYGPGRARRHQEFGNRHVRRTRCLEFSVAVRVPHLQLDDAVAVDIEQILARGATMIDNEDTPTRSCLPKDIQICNALPGSPQYVVRVPTRCSGPSCGRGASGSITWAG